jgi:hypothetical protein
MLSCPECVIGIFLVLHLFLQQLGFCKQFVCTHKTINMREWPCPQSEHDPHIHHSINRLHYKDTKRGQFLEICLPRSQLGSHYGKCLLPYCVHIHSKAKQGCLLNPPSEAHNNFGQYLQHGHHFPCPMLNQPLKDIV